MTQINNIEDLIRPLDENPQWVEALRARLLTRELIELPESFPALAEETNQRFDQIDRRSDELEKTVKRIEVDVGYLKGHRARDLAIYQAPLIDRGMGLKRVRNLTPEDLLDITDN